MFAGLADYYRHINIVAARIGADGFQLSPEAWRQAVQTEITKEKSGNARLFCNATGIYSEVYASIY